MQRLNGWAAHSKTIHYSDYFASTKPVWAVTIVRIIQVNSPKNIVGVKNYRFRVVL